MLSLKGYVPCEYSSKPRSLDVIDRCKAAEFRQFLLYTGPQVLLNVVHRNIYNFLLQCIYCLMRVCAIIYNAYAHDLLVAFVSHFGKIYDNNMLVYNVHGLVHLSKNAAEYG